MEPLIINQRVLIKRKEYVVTDVLSEHTYRAKQYFEHPEKIKEKKLNKVYIIKQLGVKSLSYSNFEYAAKRLKGAGVMTPRVYKMDKKTGLALLEFIDGETVFDMLVKAPLEDNILALGFGQNFQARINHLLLDFNPLNFIYANNYLYYIPFTFDAYKKDDDFSQKGIRLWFYTVEFKSMLIEKGLPVNPARLKPEFEQNKEIVLTVVKHYR